MTIYERTRQFALSTSHRKLFFYRNFGIGSLHRDGIVRPEIASLALKESSLAEDEIKKRLGSEYLHNGIPVPTLLSLGKAVAAVKTLTNDDPQLSFAKERRFVFTADDWVWAEGSTEDSISNIFGKPQSNETILDIVSPDRYLYSAFGVTDVLFDYPTGKVVFGSWIITCCLGQKTEKPPNFLVSPNIAGGLDIIEAIKLGLIPPKKKYTKRAELFKQISLNEAENIVNDVKLLESDKKYSKVLDLSDIPPSHPVFDNYLRGALMDISYN